MNQPTATIFAGVNGAGKTTLYYDLLEKGSHFGYRINVDEIAWSIGDWQVLQNQLRASRIALTMRNHYLFDRLDFNQETTLCGKSILRLFHELKEKKYLIVLYYVSLASAELAKERVRIRVAKGGHGVKPDLIEKRFRESSQNLLKIALLCDEVYVYDNTEKLNLINQILPIKKV